MRYWFTADQHFYHDNVLQFCNRPYATTSKMNRAIIQLWNAKIDKEDQVFVLMKWLLRQQTTTQKYYLRKMVLF